MPDEWCGWVGGGDEQKSPAWTDRVLWKSLAPFECRPLSYTACDDVYIRYHHNRLLSFSHMTFLELLFDDSGRDICSLVSLPSLTCLSVYITARARMCEWMDV